MRGPSPLYIEERHRALGRDATFSWSRALTHPLRCNRTRHRDHHLVSDFVGPPSWCRGGRHLGSEVVGAAILDLTSWRHLPYSGAYTTEIYHFSRFQRWSNIFQGGGGSNCLFPLETHITCDFPGGGPDPLSPLLIRTCSSLSHRGGGLNAFYWYQIWKHWKEWFQQTQY